MMKIKSIKGGVGKDDFKLKLDKIEEDEEDKTPFFKQGEIEIKEGKFNIFNLDQWLYFGDNDGEENYVGRNEFSEKNTHWGQLKLFLEELQIMCYFSDVFVKKVVYVGAMEGTHIALLADMFPEIHFDLYDKEGMGGDSRKFDPMLRERKNVSIYNKYFDDKDIKKYLKENPNKNKKYEHKTDIMFISDIRRVDMGELKKQSWEQTEKLVWEDMMLQQHWVEELHPYVASLKFRLPYSFDFILKEGNARRYLDGYIMRQAYASKTSSEMRLIVKGLFYREWDIVSYERKCAYHNYYTRRSKFLNIFDGSKRPYSPDDNLTLHYDPTFFMSSMKNYLVCVDIYPSEENCIALAKKVIKFIGKGKKNLFTESEKDD